MSKRVIRKTIQGKQTFKNTTSQTTNPERIITRNGPNLLEQGANLVGMMNFNPLVKLGANVLSDLLDDNPKQNPVQKMKKDDTNPVKNTICNQVQNINDQVQEIIKQNVKIGNNLAKKGAIINERNIEIVPKKRDLKPSTFVLPEDFKPEYPDINDQIPLVKSRDIQVVDPFPDYSQENLPKPDYTEPVETEPVETECETNPVETECLLSKEPDCLLSKEHGMLQTPTVQQNVETKPIETKINRQESAPNIAIHEKYSFLPSISKQVIYDRPFIEVQNVPNKNSKKIIRTISSRIDPTSIAYNRRKQAKRDSLMRERNLRPIFQPPNINEPTKEIDSVKYPTIPEVSSGCFSTNPYKNL